MSQPLINRSTDLKRLQDEGYHVEIQSSYLLIKDVPYVNSVGKVQLGILVSELTLAGNVTTTPSTHVAHFVGEHPCNRDGSKLTKIEHQSSNRELDRGLVVNHSFTSKPAGGYPDFYQKMATYIAIISSPAQSIDPKITAKTFPVIETKEEESVFVYEDTASSRAEIKALTRKLELDSVGIIGLGGTGSYVLDLVAKTPVKEIHIFDRDTYLQHNAFRSPGAASIEVLREKPKKVTYLKELYSKMHRNIVAHDEYIAASNVSQLQVLDFVFLCLDDGETKKLIVEKLEEFKVPFIDVGIGVELRDGGLGGIVRITTSTPEKREHVWNKNRIPFSNGQVNNEYSRNIQIADLNSLNAALAVIRWKKLFGFYDSLENEHYSAYTIDGNHLLNEDCL